jgi:cobalt-zinc-cadmium efflux system protein
MVNIAAFALLQSADQDNLNIRGALAHVMGDLLGSVAAIIAACVILLTGWTAIDPILSVLVAGLIAVSAVRLLRDSGRVLLEAAPPDLDPEAITTDLAGLGEIDEVHHFHLWSLTPDRPMATLHAVIAEGADPEAAVKAVKARLRTQFGLSHVTVEAETGRCADEA